MPANTIRNTTKLQTLAERRMVVSDLYRKGWSQNAIAQQLGVVQSVISIDLKAIRSEWLKSTLMDFNAAKAEQLAKIDLLEREYWQAWEDSKAERTKTRTSKMGEKPILASMEKTQRDGNLDALRGVQWCISERCKILGLYAPTRNEHTGKDGGAIQTESKVQHDLSRLTLEELIALRSMVEKTHVDLAVAA